MFSHKYSGYRRKQHDWVPAFIEITAQNMDKKKTHKILNETVYRLGILAEA